MRKQKRVQWYGISTSETKTIDDLLAAGWRVVHLAGGGAGSNYGSNWCAIVEPPPGFVEAGPDGTVRL